LLNSADLSYAKRYRRSERQKQTLAARALLRALYAKVFGKDDRSELFIPSFDGRSSIPSESTKHKVYTSISHSQQRVFVACSPVTPIGVDVEWLNPRRDMLAILQSCVLPENIADLPSDLSTQYRLWGGHEAMCKVRGGGLTFPMSHQLINMPLNDMSLIFSHADEPFFLRSVIVDEYAHSVAYRGQICDLESCIS